MILDKNSILASDDCETKEVEVPEWGGSVIIKAMSGMEREKIEKKYFSQKDGKIDLTNFRPHLLQLTLVDEDGKRIFEGPEDVKALNRKNAKVIERLFSESQKLSGMVDTEEAVENLEPAQDSDSDTV